MLTGDKVGTAKNIAAACSLLPPAFPADATDADGSARPLGEKGGGKRADRCHGGAEGGGGEGGGVLELTTETVPGLEAVPATDIAQAIAAAAAHAALPPPRKGEAARAPPPLFAELEAKHEPLAVLSREIGRAAQQEREENGGGGFNVASGARSPRASRDPSETAGWLGLGVGATLLRRGVSVCRHAGSHGPLHLIVDEKAIDWLLAVRPVDFATIALRARAVVACRCRQEQKAQMVELVKAHGNSARVLAIGDGANDVAMIKAAHVGVGIAGKEGMQAVQNADFAIGQFRFLRRLMLVHGRANGRRMALLVCYMFYKNVLDRFAQYVYTGEAAWTAVKYYSEVATQLFNVIYTSLPIIAVAVTDSDVPRAVAEALPVLYRKGVRQEVYTHGLFWSWICEALFVSGLLYYASRQTFGDAPFKRGLGAISVQSLGIICQSTIVTICTLRLALEVHAWQLLSALVFVGSLLAWAVSMLFFTSVRSRDRLRPTARRAPRRAPPAPARRIRSRRAPAGGALLTRWAARACASPRARRSASSFGTSGGGLCGRWSSRRPIGSSPSGQAKRRASEAASSGLGTARS
jgi:magnesium-transporting ATPase (P-type)